MVTIKRILFILAVFGITGISQAQTTLMPYSSTTGGSTFSIQGSKTLWSSLDGGAASIVTSNTSQMRSGFMLAVPFPARLSGTMQLMEILGSPASVTASLSLRQNGITVGTIPLSLSSQGQYAVDIPDDGTYNMLYTAPHWLRKAQSIAIFGEVAGVNIQLVNGDADGDNQVNLFDFVQLDMHFGQGADAMADLDMDGDITLFDYVIIDMFFGSQGDN